MPVIVPPHALDVPAIIRTASRSQGGGVSIHRPGAQTPVSPQPAGTLQTPEIVSPTAAPTPAPSSSSGAASSGTASHRYGSNGSKK